MSRRSSSVQSSQAANQEASKYEVAPARYGPAPLDKPVHHLRQRSADVEALLAAPMLGSHQAQHTPCGVSYDCWLVLPVERLSIMRGSPAAVVRLSSKSILSWYHRRGS